MAASRQGIRYSYIIPIADAFPWKVHALLALWRRCDSLAIERAITRHRALPRNEYDAQFLGKTFP
jgi:hypothetical protein